MDEITAKIDALLERPCYLVDIFPRTVPRTEDGRYFAVEKMFRGNALVFEEAFCKILLKLYCYYDFLVSVGTKTAENPEPGQLVKWVRHCYEGRLGKREDVNILLPACNALIVLSRDNLYMCLYNPDEPLLTLTEQLAGAEGMFCYRVEA